MVLSQITKKTAEADFDRGEKEPPNLPSDLNKDQSQLLVIILHSSQRMEATISSQIEWRGQVDNCKMSSRVRLLLNLIENGEFS